MRLLRELSTCLHHMLYTWKPTWLLQLSNTYQACKNCTSSLIEHHVRMNICPTRMLCKSPSTSLPSLLNTFPQDRAGMLQIPCQKTPQLNTLGTQKLLLLQHRPSTCLPDISSIGSLMRHLEQSSTFQPSSPCMLYLKKKL